MSNIILCRDPSADQIEKIRALYESAFPSNEKKPFRLILDKQKEGRMEIMSVEAENGAFVGLVITIPYKDIVLLDYFAISPEYRGLGIGTEVIEHIKEHCNGRTLVIEIEDTDTDCENKEDRERRRRFYLRCGMRQMPYLVWLFGVKMQILSDGKQVSFEEYHSLFNDVFSIEAGKKVIKAG